jgi:hypothetical protein
MPTLEFTAKVWLYPGETPWHFVTVPSEHADELRERAMATRRGFGSIKVEATIGATTWRTSVFPDRASESYLLPLKRVVREAEGLGEDDTVVVVLSFI